MLKSLKISTKYRIRYLLLRILDVEIAVFPLAMFVVINWDKYFSVISNASKFQNIFSLIVLAVFVFILVLKKQWLKGYLGVWIFVALIYAFRFIINDLLPISLWVAVGYTISQLTTTKLAARCKDLANKHESSEINYNANTKVVDTLVEKITNAINGRG